MTVTSILMQLVQHVQFVGMYSQIDLNWPSGWFTITNVIHAANLEFESFVGNNKVQPVPRRVVFVMVSICVPLAINVLLLVIFQPFYIVLWYLMVCAGFVTLCAGLAGKYLSTGGVAAVLDPMVLIYVGVSLIGAALLALAGFVVYRKLTAGDATMKYAEALRYYRRFHRKRALLHLGVFIFCLLIGLLLCRFVVVTMPQGSSADLLQYGGFFIVGIIFLVLAVVAFTYMVINFTREGRLLTERSTEWMKRNVLLVLLALVSTSFIPTISYAMENFMCADYTCPAGYKFNPYADRPSESYDTSEWRYCDPCAFNTTTAPICGRNVSSDHTWCPEFSESRLWKFPEVSCQGESLGYFYAAAAIVMANYLIGIPLLFFRVIRYLTRNVVKHAKIATAAENEDIDDVWQRRMDAIQPVASSLYDPFRIARRYYVLVQLLYRLLITFTITIAAGFARSAVIFVLAVHGVVSGVLLVARPYMSFGEQCLAVACAMCNVLNGAYGVVIWQEVELPDGLAYGVLALNILVPAIAFVVGLLVERRAKREKGLQDEDELALQQEREKQLESTRRSGGTPQTAYLTPQPASAQDVRQRAVNHPYDSIADNSVAGWQGGADDEDYDEDDELESTTRDRLTYVTKVRQRNNVMQTKVLNQHSTNTMNRAFMLMGIFFILALGVSLLGLTRAREEPYLVGSYSGHRTAKTVFAGFSTWDEFTSHCCCMPQTTPSPDFELTERWVCDSGVVVERGRVALDGDSGLAIRDFCSTSFNELCVAYTDIAGNVGGVCPTTSNAARVTSTFAMQYYW